MAHNIASQVTDGMDVFDSNDDKIGTVHEVYDASAAERSSSGGGYLRVPTGFLGLGTEHHIPFSAIRDVREDRIYLSVAKDRLNDMGYDATPTDLDDDEFDAATVDQTTTTTTTETSRPVAETRQRGTTDREGRRLQLREEELVARKRSVQAGEVEIHTEVVSEQRTLEVPVRREEVTIERHAVDRRPSDRPIAETSETISVPVTEEQVTLEKQPVVYEEINVGKRAVQETEHVSETVRREEAVIDREGDVKIEGEAPKTTPRR
jgi:uncharacterized protein (TIGR02271 family)